MTVQQQWCNTHNDLQPAMYLNLNIRALRKKLNLSQEELALRVGLNRGNIASYENGTAEPKICNLLKLSKIFGVSVIDLANRDLSVQITELETPELAAASAVPFHDPEQLLHLRDRANEISQVIHSLYTCFQFKLKSMTECAPEVQALQMHFEQMKEVSQSLINDHLALLDILSRNK
jgi:transcriptional regulator with XRE-family HTH domain